MEDLIHLVGPLAVLFFLLLGLAFTVFSIMGIWKMFEKADQPGWGILIPIYNLILIVRVAGLPEWMFLLLLIPVVNFVAMIIVSLEIRERFSKGVGFTVGLIFLPALFYPLLGFGSDVYLPRPAATEQAPPRPDQ
ncbi:MAG: signal peptidase I [Acidobacteriia bacterium]|nr:signal peptidase I [Terriglobia bacterium]